MRKLQEEADEEYDREHKAVMTSPAKAARAGRPKKEKGAGGGGAIAVEPITPRRDVFKEFRDKTDIGDFKVQDGLATKGEIEEGELVAQGYIPREKEIKDLLDGVELHLSK